MSDWPSNCSIERAKIRLAGGTPARFLQAVFDAYLSGPGAVAEPLEVVEAVGERLGAELAEDATVLH